jgi:diguanylate cyclase (GGDEF)-like protein
MSVFIESIQVGKLKYPSIILSSMQVSTFCFLMSVSTMMLGGALLVVSAQLKKEKTIRQLGWLVLLLGFGMGIDTGRARNEYGLGMLLANLTYLGLPFWVYQRGRAELGLQTPPSHYSVYWSLGLLAACWGFIVPAQSHFGLAAMHATIGSAYAASAMLCFSVTRRQPTLAMSMITLCLTIASCVDFYKSFVSFPVRTATITINDVSQIAQFVIAFWLLMISSFGAVMYVLQKLHLDAENTAMADPLTQVLNRRGLDRLVTDWAQPSGTTLSEINVGVIALDIDNFKPINDRFGHAEGDAVLAEFANRVRSVLRFDDAISRTGGEEFFVLLTDADLKRTQEVSERLRAVVANTPFVLTDGRAVSVTVSIGFTQATSNGKEAIDTAMLRADEAMYAAKRAGKNCVVRYASNSEVARPAASLNRAAGDQLAAS